jgi:chitin-binding protein
MTGFRVTWNASTDNVGVTGYNIYRNGAYIATVVGTTRAYAFSGLVANTTYSITVLAYDAAKNRSSLSVPLHVTTSAPSSDTTPPSAPTGLTASSITKSGLRVTWTVATDNVGVTFYNIYRNGAYVATVSGTTLSYNFTGLTAGATYSITVRALDAAKNFTNSTALSVTTLP